MEEPLAAPNRGWPRSGAPRAVDTAWGGQLSGECPEDRYFGPALNGPGLTLSATGGARVCRDELAEQHSRPRQEATQESAAVSQAGCPEVTFLVLVCRRRGDA